MQAILAKTSVRISTGVATYASGTSTDLLRIADRHLYESKGRGRRSRDRKADLGAQDLAARIHAST
jgi:PleD family two-component response regulator